MTSRRRRADAGPFGAPESWPDDDLVAVSHDIDADLTLAAYASGVFPMPLEQGLMGWWSPVRRGVLPLGGLRVTRSLRKMLTRYEIRVDTAFAEVLARCADPRRPQGWIDEDVTRVYLELHERGFVHSVEAWSGEELVGGLYGVSLGGLFAGESMFHDPDRGRDASKAALVGLVGLLRGTDPAVDPGPDLDRGADLDPDADAGPADAGPAPRTPRLLDVQWRTDHLASLGVVEVDRSAYLSDLRAALALPGPRWPGPPGPVGD